MSELEEYAKEHWKSVVLCKECRYWKHHIWCFLINRKTEENDYCSAGKNMRDERK